MRAIVMLATVVVTDALTVGSAARLQHQRTGMVTAGIFDQFKAAFMDAEEFDDRSCKGALTSLLAQYSAVAHPTRALPC